MRFYKLFPSEIILLTILFSCQNKAFFNKSMIVPVADGNIILEKVESKTFMVKVEVDDLTNPENIDSTKSYYAVWAINRRDTQKIGNLDHYRSMEEAKVIGEVEMRDIDEVVITAERKANPQEMGDLVVMRSENL